MGRNLPLTLEIENISDKKPPANVAGFFMEQEHIDNDGFPNAPRRSLAGRYFAEMTVRIPPLVVIPESFCRGSVVSQGNGNGRFPNAPRRLPSEMTPHMAFIKQRYY